MWLFDHRLIAEGDILLPFHYEIVGEVGLLELADSIRSFHRLLQNSLPDLLRSLRFLRLLL